MIWQILDWVTIAGTIALLGFGVRMATGPEGRRGSTSRRNGVSLIAATVLGLGIRLPHALRWPRSVQLAFDIPAAALLLTVAAIFLTSASNRARRRKQQKP